MIPVLLKEGTSPIILTFPHGGLHLPEDVENRLNARGKERVDTDWHIHEVYEGLIENATTLQATFHRYVIDANRDPEDQSLYPGQNTTGLCPVTDFDGQEIWLDGEQPEEPEMQERYQTFHAPYHACIAEQIARIKKRHGMAVVYDCHSIRSRIAYLFDGALPDFNVGTNGGVTCAPAIEETVVAGCLQASGYSHVLNGRFKGGWTTRHYGNPGEGVHAVQMELAQSTYMAERSPWTIDNVRVRKLRSHLKTILKNLETLALKGQV